MKHYVENIKLRNFRIHNERNIQFSDGVNVITGNNGVGKTTILEGISLLYPGRGIKSASMADMVGNNSEFWIIDALCKKDDIPFYISMNFNNKHRSITINNKKIPTQQSLQDICNITWLSPYICHKFISSASMRRQLLDRATYLFHRTHADSTNNFETLMKERIEILVRNINDNKWLEIIEDKMANEALKIHNARKDTINILRQHIPDKVSQKILIPEISVSGDFENTENSVESIADLFKKYRSIDCQRKRTNFGPHLSDFNLIHPEKKISILLSSSGEQQIMLLSILMMQVWAKKNKEQVDPIILLDDLSSQIDNSNIENIMQMLTETNCQIIISNKDDIKNIAAHNVIAIEQCYS